MRKREIELLQMLPLEERAKEQEKSPSVILLLTCFLLGLGCGLYYWFGNQIVFTYKNVAPFWGFVWFTLIGISIICIINILYSTYWKDYNNVIKDANNSIATIIKDEKCDTETLERLKKDYIERKIGKEILTREEFEWHTSRYCWGCGKKHVQHPIAYKIERERTESWKDGAFRYSKTFKKTSSIDICPECYERLKESQKKDKEKTPYIICMSIILSIGLCYASYRLWGEDIAIVCFCIILFGGFYILTFIAAVLLLPFKRLHNETKWNFDEVPDIKRFLSMNLPHTH